MKKAILLLSGTPSGKGQFEKVAKRESWVWQINPKDFLGAMATRLYWDGERNEEYKTFVSEFLSLANKFFNFEELYVREKIASFMQDESEQKEDKEGNKYERFILVVHGLSRDLCEKLKDEDGAFQLHVTSSNLKTNIESHDYCLYEDEDDFEEKVSSTIRILTN